MEFMRKFIKEGYLKAVGKLDDYKIILGATSYFDKGFLTEDDLKEISEAIEKKNKPVETESGATEESSATEENSATEEVAEPETTSEVGE